MSSSLGCGLRRIATLWFALCWSLASGSGAQVARYELEQRVESEGEGRGARFSLDLPQTALSD